MAFSCCLTNRIPHCIMFIRSQNRFQYQLEPPTVPNERATLPERTRIWTCLQILLVCLFFPKLVHNKIQHSRKKHTKNNNCCFAVFWGSSCTKKIFSKKTRAPFSKNDDSPFPQVASPSAKAQRRNEGGEKSQKPWRWGWVPMGFLGVQHDAGPMCLFLFFFPDKNFPWICLVEGL